MHDETRIERGPLAVGLTLMAVGALLGLARLDLLEVTELTPWWPLALLVVGGVVAVAGEPPKALRTGAWLGLVACWLLVNTLHLGGFRWWNSWPLLVMLAGAFRIAWPAPDEDRGGGFFVLAIGAWLLVTTQGWYGLDWTDSWPLLLVLVGIAMVLRAATQARAAVRRQS